jgi:hypothetical protein
MFSLAISKIWCLARLTCNYIVCATLDTYAGTRCSLDTETMLLYRKERTAYSNI